MRFDDGVGGERGGGAENVGQGRGGKVRERAE